MSIKDTVDTLGVTVKIKFAGIDEIYKALEKKITRGTTGLLRISPPSVKRFDEMADKLGKLIDELGIKKPIIQRVDIEGTKEEIIGKEKKAAQPIVQIDELMKKSPIGSDLLTDLIVRDIEKITEASTKDFELVQSEFSKLNLDKSKIQAVFNKLESKGYKEARKLAEKRFGKDTADMILKEMQEIKKIYDKKGQELTPTDIVDAMLRVQREQRNVKDSPFYTMKELGVETEKFRIKAIEEITTLIARYTEGEIDSVKLYGLIDDKIDTINTLVRETEKKRLGSIKKEIIEDMGEQIKDTLLKFKEIGTVTDEEKVRKLTEELYDALLTTSVVPKDVIEKSDALSERLGEADTVGKLVSFRLGGDFVKIILERMKKAVDAEKDYLTEIIRGQLDTLTESSMTKMLTDASSYIGDYIIGFTEMEKNAELFKEKYIPYINKIKETFKLITAEGGTNVEELSAAVDFVAELGGLGIERLTVLKEVFEVLSGIQKTRGELVLKLLKDVQIHEDKLFDAVAGLQDMLRTIANQARSTQDKIIKKEGIVDEVIKATNRAKVIVGNLEKRFIDIFPEESTIEKVTKQIDGLRVVITEFETEWGNKVEDMTKTSMEGIRRTRTLISKEIRSKDFTVNLATEIAQKVNEGVS